MVEKILNNTTPYGKNRASHEGSLHSSTLKKKSTESESENIMNPLSSLSDTASSARPIRCSFEFSGKN